MTDDALREMWSDLKSAVQQTERRVIGRIDESDQRLNARIDALDARIDALASDLTAVRRDVGQVSMQAVTAMLDMARTNQELVQALREREARRDAEVDAIKAHLGLK